MSIMSRDELAKLYKDGRLSDEQIEELFGFSVLKGIQEHIQSELYLGTHYA